MSNAERERVRKAGRYRGRAADRVGGSSFAKVCVVGVASWILKLWPGETTARNA